MSRAKSMLVLLSIIAAGGFVSAGAASKAFVYHQSTGRLTLNGKEVGSGYSGKGEGKNNPEKEKVRNVGPVPGGVYKIGKPREWKGMPNVFDLTPDGHDAHGRSQFLIHGDKHNSNT